MEDIPQNMRHLIEEAKIVHDELQKNLKYEDVDLSVLYPESEQIDGVRLLWFMVCLNVESDCYGKGIGMFLYKDSAVYEFAYNIHTPQSKGPRLSNQMTGIQEIVLDCRHGMNFIRHKDTGFGRMAFWDHTPMDTLDDDAKALRRLMKLLQAHCRMDGYCAKLRKTDKAHETWASRRASIS